uniref:U3 small nucleolar RNA-associated protein 25 homolog n=1 Tax=Anopheles farauti TaxID=69004 RepID=A0A182QNH6_9DIPT
MGQRRTLFKKPRKGTGRKDYMSKDMKKKMKKEMAKRPPPTRFQRNIKHIERSQEATQAQKRQIEAERKYRLQMNDSFTGEGAVSSEEEEEEEEKVPSGTFDDLTVAFNDQIGQAPVYSDDESDEEMNEEEDDEDDEDEIMLDEGEDEELEEEEELEANSSEEDQEELEEIEQDEEEASLHESDLSSDEDEDGATSTDPYMVHTAFNLSPAMLEALAAEPPRVESSTIPFGSLGNVYIELPKANAGGTASKRAAPKGIIDRERYAKPGTPPTPLSSTVPLEWPALHVKDRIVRNMNDGELDALQRDMFAILNGYQDLYYPQRTHENADRLRYVYCLHALNHVMKATSKVQHHTMKLAEVKAAAVAARRGKKKKAPTVTEDAFRRRLPPPKKEVTQPVGGGLVEFRDQGFVRPKVLIVVPFRESALQCVNVLKKLFAGDNEKMVVNYKRFTDEYGGGSSLHFPRKNPKPADYERTFAGNIDDNFRLSIALNRSSMRLYSPYYASDIMIASPLALRMAIGAKGERHRDYDFLASIELLVLDQADVCYAQNWDHVLHVMEHLHQQPSSTEYTEFSRVREWCLNGWSKFYRQTVLFTAFELPVFRGLFNKHFHNYRGKMRVVRRVTAGTIGHVVVRVPQNFQRIETRSLDGAGNARFTHFVNVVLPQARSVAMSRCLIYIPSYFDYVRLRNYFKQEEMSFTQICEYTTDAKMARARDMFFHGSKHFMLYSERAHFFRRHRIRGVRHLILYAPPIFPHFYPELVNLMIKENQNPNDGMDDASMTVTVLYTAYDMHQLAEMVGASRAKAMISAPRSVHRFTTDQK